MIMATMKIYDKLCYCVSTINTGFNDTKKAKSHVRQTKKKVEEQNKGLAMLEN